MAVKAWSSLHRRYRFKTFSQMRGQSHIVKALTKALESNSVAGAYLFSGPRGTGKTSTARLLAKSLNCPNRSGAEPCCSCDICKSIDEGSFPDLFELDAASNRGIDQIREIRDSVSLAPSVGSYKIYIIDEAHMLTKEASNALLKTLEEPPSFVVFVLATTEPERVIPTIRSRCIHFEFKRLKPEEIVDYLKFVIEQESKFQPIQIEEKALFRIAEFADGGMRDALTSLEQVVAAFLASDEEKVTAEFVESILGLGSVKATEELAEAIKSTDVDRAFEIIERIYWEGRNLNFIFEELLSKLDFIIKKASFQDLDKLADRLYSLKSSNLTIAKITVKMLIELAGENLVPLPSDKASDKSPAEEKVAEEKQKTEHQIDQAFPKYKSTNTKTVASQEKSSTTSSITSSTSKPTLTNSSQNITLTTKPTQSTTTSQSLPPHNPDLAQKLLNAVRKKSIVLSSLLREAQIWQEGENLVIFYPESKSKIFSKNFDDKKKKLVEKIVLETMGLKVLFKVSQKEEFINKVLDVFGGTLIPAEDLETTTSSASQISHNSASEDEDVVPF